MARLDIRIVNGKNVKQTSVNGSLETLYELAVNKVIEYVAKGIKDRKKSAEVGVRSALAAGVGYSSGTRISNVRVSFDATPEERAKVAARLRKEAGI